jgi:hypothetical protein
VDAGPILLVASGNTWEINDLSTEPFARYIADLRSVVSAVATKTWKPERWIVRPFGARVCSVVEEPTGEQAYDAPVYPHALAQYPLGELTIGCP